MKILYGVQATGNGHISRSREVVRALKHKGHEVHVILSGRDPKDLWDVQIFEPYEVFKGFTFVTKRGKLKLISTARNLEFLSFYNDIRRFYAAGYDVAVTDFEPVTSRIAKRWKIPCVGIGHQYAFQHKIPISGKDIPARLILKYFAPADYPIGLHWHHFNCEILPPIVPNIDNKDVFRKPEKIVVYLPFEALEDILALFNDFKCFQFFIYAGVDQPSDKGHLHIRPFSRQGFLEDLMTCEGVISNAGFELASESIHMGKKILVKPLKGQLEQESNALALKQLDLGTVMERLDKSVIKKWLDFEIPDPILYPDVAKVMADWISSGKWHELSDISTKTWVDVKMR